MKFGAFGVGGSFDQILEAAHLCESTGYDGLFFGHHHSPDLRKRVGLKQAPSTGPGGLVQWPLLGALASHTKTLELGTAIYLLAFAHPIHVAEEVATIDQISKGRIILGVGPGYNPADFEMFGIPQPNRVSLFEEGVEVIRRAWTEDHFNFVGKRYSIRNARVVPRPYRKPHPPIWIGPWTVDGFKRAARQGDGVVTDPMQSMAALKEFVAEYRTLCVSRGQKPYVALMRRVLIGRNKEEALLRFGPGLVEGAQYAAWSNYLQREYEPWLKNIKSPEEITFEMVNQDRRLLWGSPDEVVEQIHEMDKAFGGIDYLLPSFAPGTGPQGWQHGMESIRLFGEKVIPHFK